MATITITHTHSWSNAVCLHCRSVCQPQYFLFVHVVSSSLSPETHQKHTEITDKKQNSKPYEFQPKNSIRTYVEPACHLCRVGPHIQLALNVQPTIAKVPSRAKTWPHERRIKNENQMQYKHRVTYTHTHRETDRWTFANTFGKMV